MMTQIFKSRWLALFLAAAYAASAWSVRAPAEVPQVDGVYWSKSTVAQKQAYLVGVANLLSVNHALAVKRGTAASDSTLERYLKASDAQTIQTIQEKLDAWYAANPDKMDTPVLGVFWLGMVKAANR